MSDRIRVAVVGTGDWWGREHARVWSARPDSELVAIVGRTPDKTEARAAEFGTTPYTDLEAMLDRERPDLVSVCLPNEGHFEPTLRIIRAGFPLLVEKPLVFDRDEAEQLLAEAASRDLFFAINFNHRYARPVQMARAAIALRRPGRGGVRHLEVRRRGGDQRRPPRQPDRDAVPRVRHARAPVRTDIERGGAHDRHDGSRFLHDRRLARLLPWRSGLPHRVL